MLRIFELALGRKRVAVQPFEQMAAVRSDHLQLRRVQMCVDETRRDQLAREIFDITCRRVRPFTDARDAAVVIDGEMPVFEIAMRGLDAARERIGHGREDATAVDLHQISSSRMSPTSFSSTMA